MMRARLESSIYDGNSTVPGEDGSSRVANTARSTRLPDGQGP